ncbi:neurogenic locus Notch protein-like isoform X5 [Dreissena polymorpha]|uniref:neurogenic locus Notch protein-like isoform X5 n=1 Tax=Dreissena polymorpha TaxID=45954 RepID=UPI0022649D3E|nr:neurogenic locus Notch protein-like isoform X5 [Dreissena polymorpha]
MVSLGIIYKSALLVITWQCMDCQQEEKHTVVKLGAKPCKFSEGQQEEKHAIVKRGAMPIHCYHKCPGGDDECYFDSNINDYRCKCPCRSQYCEYAEERCNNRGTCVPISGNTDFTCTNCISGWKGKQCHLIDCNSGVYCTNGGVCVDDVSSGTDYRCICKEGWTGKDCQFIDCSSPIRCMNGGQCHLQNGGKEFNCTCADGYLGENCQIGEHTASTRTNTASTRIQHCAHEDCRDRATFFYGPTWQNDGRPQINKDQHVIKRTFSDLYDNDTKKHTTAIRTKHDLPGWTITCMNPPFSVIHNRISFPLKKLRADP